MATLKDAILPIAFQARGIAGELGFRPYRVFILQGSWSGANTGYGTETSTEVEILENGQPPRVEWMDGEEIALNEVARGAIKIGAITPAFAGGGTDLSVLLPAVDRGETVHIKLVGPEYPNGALYAITDVDTQKAHKYLIQAQPVSE